MAATVAPCWSLRHINALRSAGLIPAARYLDTAAAVRDTALWRQCSRRALLTFGAGHLLAGIVFFFAYNWAQPHGRVSSLDRASSVQLQAPPRSHYKRSTNSRCRPSLEYRRLGGLGG